MIKKEKILLIDDEEDFCFFVKNNLELTGRYEVVDCFGIKDFAQKGFTTEAAVFRFLDKENPDLIILDLNMPGMSGFEICRSIKKKERFTSVPIIILSAKGAEPDKVSGLDMGADDYIVKPFSISELNDRIRAVMRRFKPFQEEDKIKVGDQIEIDMKKYQVLVNGKEVKLTHAEFTILEFLCSRKGQVLTRDRILDYLWGDGGKSVIGRTVDVHIRHLRKKLGKIGKFIHNVRGLGYKFEEKE